MSYPIYKIARWCLRRLFYLTGGLKVIGAEGMPTQGPLIVACNHSSFWDPMILGAAFNRPLHFMARKTLFDIPLFGWLIRQTLAFPLDRGGDSRSAIRTFGGFLGQNEVVLIFPEGTRTHDGRLGTIKPGVGMMAVHNSSPVLPVYIWGSFQSWPRGQRLPQRHHLKVLVGHPIVPAAIPVDRKEEQRRITEAVMRSLTSLEAMALEPPQPPAPVRLDYFAGI
ncbi:MAG: 1-acyl-sn-glycerol-3-phosphate acyltransferase [Planctomycetota bacterium]|jgi:1-acyl-sn-glycerol-3-phosphate acyltransferase|nr:1-acyl-sn-glycerol-3-phosphate acyltransferase [Planctomycetota bacterium]